MLIENSGTNYVNTFDLFASYPNVAPPAYQMSDLEHAVTNWVLPGNPFEVVYSDTTNDVIHSHGHVGRIVDLEVQQISRRGLGSTFDYSTINLTNQ